MAVRLTLHAEGFDRVRRNLSDQQGRARTVIRDISPLVVAYLREGIADFFQREAGPDGPWQALAESTIEHKGHSRILYETGRLEAALTDSTPDSIIQIRRLSLIFGVDLYYALKHEIGLFVARRGFMPYGEQVDSFVAHRAAERILGYQPGVLGGPVGFELSYQERIRGGF